MDWSKSGVEKFAAMVAKSKVLYSDVGIDVAGVKSELWFTSVQVGEVAPCRWTSRLLPVTRLSLAR